MINAPTQQKTASRRRFHGTVTRAAAQKTITVRVGRFFRHPRFQRVVHWQKAFLVHDEAGVARPGDEVIFEEVRPLSKRKRWQLVEVVKQAREQEEDAPEKES